MNNVQAPYPDNDAHSAHHQGDGQCGQPGALTDTLAGNLERPFRHFGKILAVVGLMVEGLNGLDLGKVLAHVAADIGNPVLA